MKHTKEAAILESMRDRRWTSEQALAVLDAQASSGLSVQTFAAEHDLSAERLYYWRRRLKTSGGVRRDEVQDVEFMPVLVTDRRSTAAVRVRLGDVEVEVADPRAVDPTWLAATVSLLKERSCC